MNKHRALILEHFLKWLEDNMGRKRQGNHNLPPRMNVKNGWYYHVSSTIPRKWTPLGDDLNEARRKWAEMEDETPKPDDKTFQIIGQRYMREILPTLKAHTQHKIQNNHS